MHGRRRQQQGSSTQVYGGPSNRNQRYGETRNVPSPDQRYGTPVEENAPVFEADHQAEKISLAILDQDQSFFGRWLQPFKRLRKKAQNLIKKFLKEDLSEQTEDGAVVMPPPKEKSQKK